VAEVTDVSDGRRTRASAGSEIRGGDTRVCVASVHDLELDSRSFKSWISVVASCGSGRTRMTALPSLCSDEDLTGEIVGGTTAIAIVDSRTGGAADPSAFPQTHRFRRSGPPDDDG
jgi:hypothetical protein